MSIDGLRALPGLFATLTESVTDDRKADGAVAT